LRALTVAVLCALIFPASAWAHATLLRTVPANGAVLGAAPTKVRLVFDETVRPASGIRAIRNDGASVLAGKARVVGGRMLLVPLRSGLPHGDYTVLWRVVSDDGHTVAGVIAFAVGAGRSPPTAALTVGNGPTVKDVIARWLLFTGLLTAVGAAVFRFAVGPVPVRLLLGAFLLVFVGVSGLLHDVPVASRFGGAMVAVAIVAAVGALLAAIAPVYPVVEPAAFAAAIVMLPGPSIAGHALDRGRSPIEVVDDVLHVAAASVWLGGLVALGLALRTSGTTPLRRFSNIAIVSVAVLGLTGVVRALSELSAFSQLWTTGYGRALLVKTGLLAVLVGLGWINRYRLVPRADVQGLRRTVPAELLLFAGLVIAVALLTDLRPGRDRSATAAVATGKGPPPLPAAQMVVQAGEAGDYAVALAVKPPGEEVTVLGPDGAGVNGLSVEIDGQRMGSCGNGCYGAFVPLHGKATVVVNKADAVRFRIPPHPRPAPRLVTRAARAFQALRSVDYVERLASSPRNRVVADFTLERPNRLEYRIRGGASGIIIGPRRWDRTGHGPWLPSPQDPTPQPEPIWAGHFTNAFLLDATPTSYLVSFMKPLGPTWFTIRLDRRTLLPRDLRMTTAAHFMTHRYTRFNAPRRIKPPPVRK
jgi:copper transport protein